MKKVKVFYWGFTVLALYLFTACNKKEFLEAKPNSDIVIPSTLEDFQALLDNELNMSETPAAGEISSDNYYLTNNFWAGLKASLRNSYTWEEDIYNGEGNISDWNKPYVQVFNANIVLEGLQKISMTNDEEKWKKIKGTALFMRAYAFYNIAQIYAPAYDMATANTDLGIPLRLKADINEATVRSTVKETYDKIIADLIEAAPLLPEAIEANRNRPSRPAIFAMLARVLLSKRDYVNAYKYSDSALQLYSTLIRYDTVNKSLSIPFNPTNDETLYQSKLISNNNVLIGFFYPNCIIDSTLYYSYSANDLRSSIFYIKNFNGQPNLKGSYNGTFFLFSGLATDELYLIRAECQAKSGAISAAMADLNTLLRNRWERNTFMPRTAIDQEDALKIIREERRKELAFRGLRWTDIRRLNKEGANIHLKRILNGQPHDLKPNSSLYVLPIPPDVITLSGITQNIRKK